MLIELALAAVLHTPPTFATEISYTPRSYSSSIRPSISSPKPSTYNVGRASYTAPKVSSPKPSISTVGRTPSSVPIKINSATSSPTYVGSTRSPSASTSLKTSPLSSLPRSEGGAIKIVKAAPTSSSPKVAPVKASHPYKVPTRSGTTSVPLTSIPKVYKQTTTPVVQPKVFKEPTQPKTVEKQYVREYHTSSPVIVQSSDSVLTNPWFWMAMQESRQPQTVVQQVVPTASSPVADMEKPPAISTAVPVTQTKESSIPNIFVDLIFLTTGLVLGGWIVIVLKNRR